jgi:uncharacterized protein with PQ loop repeat
MEALSDNTTLIDTVGIIGIVSSQIMNLSALPSMMEIYRAKNTLLYPTFPFAVGIVSSVTNIPYAILTQRWLPGTSSVLTLIQNGIYEFVHLKYSRKRKRIATEFFSLLFAVIISMGIGPGVKCAVHTSECESFTIQWLGIVMAIVACMRYGSQAATFGRVVRTKNAASISPPMTAGAMFSSAIWTWYSLLVGDPYYLASGLAGLLSCSIQIVFLIMFPRIMPVVPRLDKIHQESQSIRVTEHGSIISEPRSET